MKKQAVYAGDKYFPTMTKLAQWLGIPKMKLSNLFEGRDSIFYNGVTLKKTDPLPEPKVIHERKPKTNHDRKPKPVLVNGVAYNSCSEAERALKFPKCVLSGALNAGQKFYKGYAIEYGRPSDAPEKDLRKVKTGVYCTNLNKHFTSIQDASRFAKVDSWTMSKKMEFAGKFIDDVGNIYVREKPMKTINVYKNTGATLKRKVTKEYTRTVKVDDKEPESLQNEVPQIVKDAITDKIKELFKNSELRDQITDLMKHAGFKKLIFTLDEIENN